jgi:tRNA(Ile)-lysidine synthase
LAVPKYTTEQKVLRYIRGQGLVSRGQKLVVAVSGGPDSVCLLHVLLKLRKELDIDLHIAHLNHRLRGKESEADAVYVGELARKLGIDATIAARDVKSYRARRRLSLEEAAREVRYSFLAEVAASIGAERVAVGHTADDHVETILMHLIRGSGIGGLRGLRPITRWQSSDAVVTIIRPLLELTRDEAAAYCRHHRLHPRLDASNLSPEMFRNRIRQELIPLLRAYNPRVSEALRRTARLATDDFDFIEKEATLAWDALVRREGEAVILDRKKLLALPLSLKRHLLRAAVASASGDLKDIEAGHIEDMLGALEKPAGKTINLPEGLNFAIEYDSFVLAPNASTTCPFPALDQGYALTVPGITRQSGWEIEAAVTTPDEIEAPEAEEGFTACCDLDKTGSVLTVRHRLRGDRFQPLGLNSPKKLSSFMIDARIPRAWRGSIPIVASPGQIIWVAGWRIDERVKVTAKTKNVLRLEFRRH